MRTALSLILLAPLLSSCALPYRELHVDTMGTLGQCSVELLIEGGALDSGRTREQVKAELLYEEPATYDVELHIGKAVYAFKGRDEISKYGDGNKPRLSDPIANNLGSAAYRTFIKAPCGPQRIKTVVNGTIQERGTLDISDHSVLTIKQCWSGPCAMIKR